MPNTLFIYLAEQYVAVADIHSITYNPIACQATIVFVSDHTDLKVIGPEAEMLLAWANRNAEGLGWSHA